MNIEQIKKDWEAHCNKNGKTSYTSHGFFENKDDLLLKTKKENRSAILIIENELHSLKIYDTEQEDKIFTTFYEKLMKEIDND